MRAPTVRGLRPCQLAVTVVLGAISCAAEPKGQGPEGDSIASSALADCAPELRDRFVQWRATHAADETAHVFISARRWYGRIYTIIAIESRSKATLKWSDEIEFAGEPGSRVGDWRRVPDSLSSEAVSALRSLGQFRQKLIKERVSQPSAAIVSCSGGSHSNTPEWWQLESGPGGTLRVLDHFMDLDIQDDGRPRPEVGAGRAMALVLSELDDRATQLVEAATDDANDVRLIEVAQRIVTGVETSEPR